MFRKENFFVAGILLVLFVQGWGIIQRQGQTTDETFFNASGYPIVRYNSYAFLGEHPPFIMQLASLPLLVLRPVFPVQLPLKSDSPQWFNLSAVGEKFLYQNKISPDQLLTFERLPILCLLVLTCWFVFQWSRQLWGAGPAIGSLLLCAFCPNLLAHGTLFTTDMGVTCFYFFCFFLISRFWITGKNAYLIVSAIMATLAVTSKISGLILIPAVLFLILCIRNSANIPQFFSMKAQRLIWLIVAAFTLLAVTQKALRYSFVPISLLFLSIDAKLVMGLRGKSIFCFMGCAAGLYGLGVGLQSSDPWVLRLIAIGVLCLGMLCVKPALPFIAQHEGLWRRCRNAMLFLGITGIGVALVYTDFAWTLFNKGVFFHFFRNLHISMNHMLAGHTSCSDFSWIPCDWRYFPALLLVKVPFLSLFLWGAGAWVLLTKKPPREYLPLVVPVIFFLVTAMFLSRIRIGIRHILPILPFLYVMAGGAFFVFQTRWLKVLMFLLVIFSLVRTVSFFPDYLSFFNEGIKNPESAATVLTSNYDWGQDNKRLAEFVIAKKIPFIKIISEAMSAGIYDYYKIQWKMADQNDLMSPVPGFYALSIRCYAQLNREAGSEDSGLKTRDTKKSWFKGKPPLYRVGKTFYIFDVPEGPSLRPPAGLSRIKHES